MAPGARNLSERLGSLRRGMTAAEAPRPPLQGLSAQAREEEEEDWHGIGTFQQCSVF